MRMPETDSAVYRAVVTALQSIVGLLVAVWAIPGVPDTVGNYVANNTIAVLLMIGVPAGVASLVWNVCRPSVKNY